MEELIKFDVMIDGEIVVYGDCCQYVGCNVEDGQNGIMNCFCYLGQYDFKWGCKVVGGLFFVFLFQLLIKFDGDKLVVDGFFMIWFYGYNFDEDWEIYIKKVEELLL